MLVGLLGGAAGSSLWEDPRTTLGAPLSTRVLHWPASAADWATVLAPALLYATVMLLLGNKAADSEKKRGE